ncbi:MAG: 3-deoxy-7-phosphoheptulonate synthase, partial [Candidatus Limnocylindria bacterium]
GVPERIIVDASHGNSERDYLRQPAVAEEIAAQIAAGERGITGVMVESFLVAGRQELTEPARLLYGQSITDACIGWEDTVTVLQGLAAAARARRVSGEGQRPRVASTKR